jgi:hypothetical protein
MFFPLDRVADILAVGHARQRTSRRSSSKQ